MYSLQRNSAKFHLNVQIPFGKAIYLLGKTKELQNPIRMQCIDDNIWFHTVTFLKKPELEIIEYEYIEADWYDFNKNKNVLGGFQRTFEFNIINPNHQVLIFDKVDQDRPFLERIEVLDLSKMKHITINHVQKVNFGEALYVVGNVQSLNNRSKGYRLEWSAGDVWTGTISIPIQDIIDQQGLVTLMIIKSFYHKRDGRMWIQVTEGSHTLLPNEKPATFTTSNEINPFTEEECDTMKLKFSKELPPNVISATLFHPKLGFIPLQKIKGFWVCEIEILRSQFSLEDELNFEIDIIYGNEHEQLNESHQLKLSYDTVPSQVVLQPVVPQIIQHSYGGGSYGGGSYGGGSYGGGSYGGGSYGGGSYGGGSYGGGSYGGGSYGGGSYGGGSYGGGSYGGDSYGGGSYGGGSYGGGSYGGGSYGGRYNSSGSSFQLYQRQQQPQQQQERVVIDTQNNYTYSTQHYYDVTNKIAEQKQKIVNPDISRACTKVLESVQFLDPNIFKIPHEFRQVCKEFSKQNVSFEQLSKQGENNIKRLNTIKVKMIQQKAQIVEEIDNCKKMIHAVITDKNIKEKLNVASNEHQILAKQFKQMDDLQFIDSLLELYLLSLEWAQMAGNQNQERDLMEIQVKVYQLIQKLFELPPNLDLSKGLFLAVNDFLKQQYIAQINQSKSQKIEQIFSAYRELDLTDHQNQLEIIKKKLFNPTILELENDSEKADFYSNLVYCILYSLQQHSEYENDKPIDVFREIDVNLFRDRIHQKRNKHIQTISELEQEIKVQDEKVNQCYQELINSAPEEIQAVISMHFDLDELKRELQGSKGLDNQITILTGEMNNQIQIIKKSPENTRFITAKMVTKNKDIKVQNYVLEKLTKQEDGSSTIKQVHAKADLIFKDEKICQESLKIISEQMMNQPSEFTTIISMEIQIALILQYLNKLKIYDSDYKDFIRANQDYFRQYNEEQSLVNKILIVHERLTRYLNNQNINPQVLNQQLNLQSLIDLVIQRKNPQNSLNPDKLQESIYNCNKIIEVLSFQDQPINQTIKNIKELTSQEKNNLESQNKLSLQDVQINLLVLAKQWGKQIMSGNTNELLITQVQVVKALESIIKIEELRNQKDEILRSCVKLNTDCYIFTRNVSHPGCQDSMQSQYKNAFTQYTNPPQNQGIYEALSLIYKNGLEQSINIAQNFQLTIRFQNNQEKNLLPLLLHYCITYSIARYLDPNFPIYSVCGCGEFGPFCKETDQSTLTLANFQQLQNLYFQAKNAQKVDVNKIRSEIVQQQQRLKQQCLSSLNQEILYITNLQLSLEKFYSLIASKPKLLLIYDQILGNLENVRIHINEALQQKLPYKIQEALELPMFQEIVKFSNSLENNAQQ